MVWVEEWSAEDHQGWTRICSDVFVPLETSICRTFRGHIDELPLAGASVSRVVCDPCLVTRSESAIRRAPRDDVLVNVISDGSAVLTEPHRTVPLAAGALAVCDADREYSLVFSAPATVVTLRVPRRALPERSAARRHRAGGFATHHNGVATVLRHYLLGLIAAGDPGPQDAEALLAGAIDLVRLLLRHGAGLGEVGRLLDRRERFGMLKAHLERHGADPGLTVDGLARCHGVSRRHVEALFAENGLSPAAHLRGVRLGHSRELLRREPGLSLADVAFRSGFDDVATFGRAFRRASGTTPGRWRIEHAGPESGGGRASGAGSRRSTAAADVAAQAADDTP